MSPELGYRCGGFRVVWGVLSSTQCQNVLHIKFSVVDVRKTKIYVFKKTHILNTVHVHISFSEQWKDLHAEPKIQGLDILYTKVKTVYRRLEKKLTSELVEKAKPDVTLSTSDIQTAVTATRDHRYSLKEHLQP